MLKLPKRFNKPKNVFLNFFSCPINCLDCYLRRDERISQLALQNSL